MSQNLTINGEAVSASQQGPLAVEEFLQENYLFRNNVLSGKVDQSYYEVVPVKVA